MPVSSNSIWDFNLDPKISRHVRVGADAENLHGQIFFSRPCMSMPHFIKVTNILHSYEKLDRIATIAVVEGHLARARFMLLALCLYNKEMIWLSIVRIKWRV